MVWGSILIIIFAVLCERVMGKINLNMEIQRLDRQLNILKTMCEKDLPSDVPPDEGDLRNLHSFPERINDFCFDRSDFLKGL